MYSFNKGDVVTHAAWSDTVFKIISISTDNNQPNNCDCLELIDGMEGSITYHFNPTFLELHTRESLICKLFRDYV